MFEITIRSMVLHNQVCSKCMRHRKADVTGKFKKNMCWKGIQRVIYREGARSSSRQSDHKIIFNWEVTTFCSDTLSVTVSYSDEYRWILSAETS